MTALSPSLSPASHAAGACARLRFSLVELLVVILIILMLAGALLPVLGRALAKARTSLCLSNTKQIGAACISYATEFDTYMPPALTAAPSEHWLNYLYVDYVDRRADLLACPALAEDECFNPYGGEGPYAELTQAGYIMNIIRETGVNGWSCLPADISTDYDRSFGWIDGTSTRPVRLARVREPAAKVYQADAAPALNNPMTAIGIARITETDHGPVDPDGNGVVNAGERQTGWLHGGRCSVMFGDGHAAEREHTQQEEWNVHQHGP